MLIKEIKSSAKGNFLIEEGDMVFIPRVMSDSDASRLQYLFNLLVADFPIHGQDDFLQQSLTEKCDEIIKRFSLRKDSHFHVSPTIPVKVDGSTLHLKPSFQWLNGRDIYYQKVSIDQTRIEATQKDVTSATWMLQRLKESSNGAETRALIKLSEADDGLVSDWRASEYIDLLKGATDLIINVDNDEAVELEFSALHS